jgi:C-terminal processing protease CtpA/Prc
LPGPKWYLPGTQPHPKGISVTNSKYSGRQVEEIIRFLETKYVGQVSADSMVDHAIEAVMTGLDPHTHYFPPDQMDELEERTMGHYVGIGVEIAFINDSLLVLYPKKIVLPNMQASCR